jgi:hypothetical protein
MAIELANYFLTNLDEENLSAELQSIFPSLKFVDGQIWSDATPPSRESISECESGLAYFWWKDLVPVLPSKAEANGRFRGPVTAVTLQFPRCRIQDNRLKMGQMRVEVSVYAPEMAKAVRTVFKTMRRKYSCTAACVRFEDGFVFPKELKSYLIGPNAIARSAEDLKLAIHAVSYLIPKSKKAKG